MNWKHPITLIAVVAVVIVGLYYLVSPYEKCLRNAELEKYNPGVQKQMKYHCSVRTHW